MTFRALVPLVLVVASTAFGQRVSFPNFAGPGAGNVRNQIVGAVCDNADCVNAGKTTTGNKPDWKKAKKESVAFFVTGTVAKKGKNLSLNLQVLNKAGPPVKAKVFALEKNGTLSAKNLQSAMDMLNSAFGSKAPAPPPDVTPPPDNTPPQDNTPPPPTKKDPPPDDTPPPTRRADKAPPPGDDPTGVGLPPVRKKKKKFLWIDAGADIVTRRLVYNQVATPNLRRYDLPPVGQPSLGVKFFPLALMRDDLLAGLGLDVQFAFAPWIQSRLISSGDPYPTSTIRFDGGIRFDIVPVQSFQFAITPYVGVRYHSFTVGQAANGTRIDGLPNTSYVGLRAGLGVDVPIGPISVFGRFLVIPVFSSGEIISSAFFPNGSTFGIEANGGVGVRIVDFLQVRASFEFINYGLTFRTMTGDAYVAAGATDTWIGGNASVRLSF